MRSAPLMCETDSERSVAKEEN